MKEGLEWKSGEGVAKGLMSTLFLLSVLNLM